MDSYTKKEEARMALESALRDYHQAAESYETDFSDMASEIEDACAEAGIKVDVIAS